MTHHRTCKDVIVSDSTDVVSFQWSDVPEFLRQTEFFSSLEDDGEEITLPRQFFKADLIISTPADARDVLSTMRFWGVEKIPLPLILYIAKSFHQDLSDMLSHFTPELKVVEFLRLLNRELYPIRPSTYEQFILSDSLPHKRTTVESVVSILAVQFENECGRIWNARTTALAAKYSSLDCLVFLHEMGCPWDASTCANAAARNRLDFLKYAHAHGCPWDARTTAQALESHSVACFTYARDNGCPWDANTCSAAARTGNLALLKSAHESGCPWNEQTCDAAVRASSLECLKYAHKQGCPWSAATCVAAAEAGNLAALTYLHEKGCPWNEDTCVEATRHQSSACLAYAHKNGCPWGAMVVSHAALFGHLNCLRYALENGCPGREIACDSVYSSLACLKYLREELNCPWSTRIADTFADSLFRDPDCLRYCLEQGCLADENTLLLAIKHVDKIKVLLEHGCPWSKRTLHAVARLGKLEIFKYCLENGCPGREDVVLAAAPHLLLLQYLHSQGCPLSPKAYECALQAVRPIECVRFLFETGCCPWPKDACTWFVQHRRMDCLKYAHMHGAPWDADTCAAAVQMWPYGRDEQQRALDFLMYLREEGCPWDAQTLLGAKGRGNTLCYQYALQHGCPDIEVEDEDATDHKTQVDAADIYNTNERVADGTPVDRIQPTRSQGTKRKRTVSRNSVDEEFGGTVRRSQRISQVLGAAFGQSIQIVKGWGSRLVKVVRRSERISHRQA